MALFNAATLLNDDETEHNLASFDNFRDPQTGEIYSLTITVRTSLKIIEDIMELSDRCTQTRIFQHQKGKRRGETEFEAEIDHRKFVNKALSRVYVASSGDVLDEHSKEAIIALTHRIPGFLFALSRTLLDFYQSGNVFIQEQREDDEKN